MKKFLFTVLTVLSCIAVNAQAAKGLKIGYIDMDYILDKVPDYAEAKNQLEQKANKWQQEMQVKRNDISKLKEGLQAEKALLTKELIEEREEEIAFLEKDLIEYQEKRFGPTGDFISQKSVLVKPVQDQVFSIVQDLATSRKFDFIFDKSSDLTMMFAAKKYDISDYVVKRLTRSAKREKLSGKEVKELDEQEKQEELEADPEYADRKKATEDKKAERQKKLDEKKAAQEAKKAAYDARRQQLKEEQEAKRNGAKTGKPATATTPKETPATTETDGEASTEKPADATATDKQDAAKAAKDAKLKALEDRKKAIEERKKKILEDREAAKKAREDAKNGTTTTPPATETPATSPTDGDD
ncbi:OmpH family outer membrane protein [Flavobacterium zepuense]|uniref:OmpH family outer membrane protein n=1 Tax=Flavobacterium zepuense TaxID=2593302 RepID=A0A552UUN9_9FLAO|nr:OmpH family outer membrane protein [Flavobacterium zepuense]TRW21907.1 OmpH family outer membrane protein [Flavobacterium zepuense]